MHRDRRFRVARRRALALAALTLALALGLCARPCAAQSIAGDSGSEVAVPIAATTATPEEVLTTATTAAATTNAATTSAADTGAATITTPQTTAAPTEVIGTATSAPGATNPPPETAVPTAASGSTSGEPVSTSTSTSATNTDTGSVEGSAVGSTAGTGTPAPAPVSATTSSPTPSTAAPASASTGHSSGPPALPLPPTEADLTDPNKAPPTIRLEYAVYSIPADFPYLWISAYRTGGLSGPASASWTTADSSAIAGIDYRSSTGQLQWSDGVGGAQQLYVPLIARQSGPYDRQFSVLLHTQSGAGLVFPAAAVVTITQPSPWQLWADSSTAPGMPAVGGSGSGSGDGSVSPSANPGGSTTTPPAGSDGSVGGTFPGPAVPTPSTPPTGEQTATGGGGTPNPNPSSGSGGVTPSATGGSGPSGATGTAGGGGGELPPLGTGTGLLTQFASAFVWDSSAYQTDNSNSFVVVGVTRLQVLPFALQACSVKYQTVDGTARAGVDYTAASGTLEYGANDFQPRMIFVPIRVGDNTTSPTGMKLFAVRLFDPNNAFLGAPSTSPVSIAAVPFSQGKIVLSADAYATPIQAGTVVVTAFRQIGSTGTVTVTYATTDGTASAGTDFVSTNGTVTWADGDASPRNITIPLLPATSRAAMLAPNAGVANAPNFFVSLALAQGSGGFLGTPRTAALFVTNQPPVTPPASSSSSSSTGGTGPVAASSTGVAHGSSSTGTNNPKPVSSSTGTVVQPQASSSTGTTVRSSTGTTQPPKPPSSTATAVSSTATDGGGERSSATAVRAQLPVTAVAVCAALFLLSNL